MKEYLVLLKRELKSITKEKTIMFAILIQFCIASLSSIIVVGIMAFYDPASISQNTRANITVGLVEAKPGYIDSFLTQPSSGIYVKHFNSQEQAEQSFKAGRIDAIIVPPENQVKGVVDMKLVLPELDTKQTVVLMMLQGPLKNYENFLRSASGIQTPCSDLGGKPSNTYEFLYSLIIPILMLFPALIAGSIMIDSVSEEFENQTFDTLMASPVSLRQVFAAKVSAAIVTALLQVILWAGLLKLNGIEIENPVLVLLLAVIVAAIISFAAAFIALFFRDRERAQFVYSMVLVALVSGSYFVGFSPLNLLTTISSGVPGANIATILIYPALLAMVGFFFFKFSRRLIFTRR